MSIDRFETLKVGRHGVTRRECLVRSAGAAAAAGLVTWHDVLSAFGQQLKKQGKSFVLLWMAGGPSQFETFDPKPDSPNGGGTKAISTAVPGVRIAEGWDNMASVLGDVALIRSMTNREGSHPRATYQLHTGYLPSGSVKHPALGCALAKEVADLEADLPPAVSIGTSRLTVGAGFLGVAYEPFRVASPGRLPDNTAVPTTPDRARRRLGLLQQLEQEFAARGGRPLVENHRQLYDRASRLMLSPKMRVFQLDDEPQGLRDAYGDSTFGRGCLLARRLVEAGVPYIEVISGGWDTHDNNFERTATLAQQVDPAAATLLKDLKQRGLLEKTVVVWMGEFGRTPRVNPRSGRDHYPRAFSAWIAGGGLRGGLVVGRTSPNGTSVEDRPVTPADLFCTICHAMGVDPRIENLSPLGRPMKIVDGGEPIAELLGSGSTATASS
ncbi:MAG: DUF1501 domain-containing protein [Planctomycetota bacterium]|nr:MAG: DUF1501 domain-containing protein [Planctomycetota bacterium]